MSGTFVKLFGSIVTSTIWGESSDIRVVWITMLALSDPHGKVEATVPGLARIAGVSLEACEQALAKFTSPDRYSRSSEHEGRRVEVVDGGFLLLNYAKYRQVRDKETRKEQNREAKRRQRDGDGVADADSQQCQPRSAQEEEEVEGDLEGEDNLISDPDLKGRGSAEGEAATPPPAEPAPAKRARTDQGSRLPEQWEPSSSRAYESVMYEFQDVIALADIPGILAAFRDYWHGVPGQKGRKSDWDGTFRNHLRREGEYRRTKRGGRQQSARAQLPISDYIDQMAGGRSGK